MLPALIAATLLITIAGVILLAVGVRGRRIDDHPVCRRCGFDLVGRPDSSTACPECGSPLDLPRAFRIGNRRRRTGPLLAGLLLLTLAAVITVGTGWALYAKLDLNPYKPLWALQWEAQGPPGPAADAALKEINARLAAQKLTDAQIAHVADLALAVQGNRALPWNPRWGDFVESARQLHKLSDDRWHQYAAQAPDFTITFRPRVRRGDPLTYRNREGPSRVGNGLAVFVASCADGIVTVSGQVIRDNDVIGRRPLRPGNYGVEGTGTFNLAPILDQLPDGPQSVKISCDALVYDSFRAKTPLARRHVEFTGSFTLTPSTQPTLKLIHDESLRPAIERGLAIPPITVNQGYLYTTVAFNNIPVPLAYDLFIRDPAGHERKVAGFNYNPKSRINTYGLFGPLDPLPPPVVDVLLRPNHDYPLRTIDTFEIWDHDIVIKNVPVTLPTTRSTQQP